MLHRALVPLGLEAGELVKLLAAHRAIVDFEDGDISLAIGPVFVHPDDGLPLGIDAPLRGGRRLLDHALWDAGLDGLGHAPEFLDFLDMRERAFGEIMRQALDVEAAAPRIDDAGCAGFLLK